MQSMFRNILGRRTAKEGSADSPPEDADAGLTDLVLRENLVSLGRLASGIAHEFGNPLTTISSLAQLLRRRRSDDAFVREQAELIEMHVRRLSKLSRQLVDLAFPRTPKLTDFDVGSLLEDTLTVAHLDRRLKTLEIETELPDGPLRARADPGAVHLVLLNLLFNAADAMEGEGRLTIRAVASDAGVEVRVEDTGPGIPEEVRPHVFSPFFTTKPPGAGTGLGLSISCRLARACGGELALESTGRDGTGFLLTLCPAVEEG